MSVYLSVVIPHVAGRDEVYEMVISAYRETLVGVDYEIITVNDRPNCGMAWQEGAEIANGKYLHLGADDLEPLPGWFQAATYTVGFSHAVPGARIIRPDGSLESCANWETEGKDGQPADLARVPFCTMDMWDEIGPMIPLQYYSDNWFHERAKRIGYPCRINRKYSFVHHRPANLRPGESDQMIRDMKAFEMYMASGYDGPA